MGRYSEAIDCWMEKLPLSKTALESTWLHHEIGRCHLELKNYQDAKEYGQKSLAAAEEADDKVWQLNARVLISQAEGLLLVRAYFVCCFFFFFFLFFKLITLRYIIPFY